VTDRTRYYSIEAGGELQPRRPKAGIECILAWRGMKYKIEEGGAVLVFNPQPPRRAVPDEARRLAYVEGLTHERIESAIEATVGAKDFPKVKPAKNIGQLVDGLEANDLDNYAGAEDRGVGGEGSSRSGWYQHDSAERGSDYRDEEEVL
jgi:hypothetical protein